MKSVFLVSEVENTCGCLGFSVLQQQWDGSIQPTTVLYLRDMAGFCMRALIVPAATVKGAF